MKYEDRSLTANAHNVHASYTNVTRRKKVMGRTVFCLCRKSLAKTGHPFKKNDQTSHKDIDRHNRTPFWSTPNLQRGTGI